MQAAAEAPRQGSARQPKRLRVGARAALAACLAVGAGVAVAGCGQHATASSSIQLGTAYLTKPTAQGQTEAYVTIQNNGAADRLTAVRTSAGGVVTFSGPSRQGTVAMRDLPDIVVPARTTMRLVPNGPHLVIVGAGRMKSGTEITLTLTFARAGTFSVPAVVTNPATGGSTYFVN